MGMIVDAHAHACGEYLTKESIEKKMEKAGSDKLILTPGQYGSKTTYKLKDKTAKDPLADVLSAHNKANRIMMKLIGTIRTVPKGNEYVYGLTKQLPGKVFQSYWITEKNIEKLWEDYERMKFVGVKLHQCWEDFLIGDPYFSEAARFAQEKQLPLFLHLYCREEVRKLIGYIRNHPKLKVIVGHLYSVEDFFEVPVEELKNVHFDLSNCFFTSKERFLRAYEHFGADYFLLGSDTPFGKDAFEQTKAQIENSGIPEEDVRKICGENAAALFGLK